MPERNAKPLDFLVHPGDRRFSYACQRATCILVIAMDPESDIPRSLVDRARAQVELSVESSLAVHANLKSAGAW